MALSLIAYVACGGAVVGCTMGGALSAVEGRWSVAWLCWGPAGMNAVLAIGLGLTLAAKMTGAN